MTLKRVFLAVAISSALSACGGGGGGSSTTPTGSTGGTTTYTPPSGETTAQVTGVVVNDVTQGATITAYEVIADGTNGAVIGVSAPTGADGKFGFNFSKTPTGPVRLIARGGTFISEASGKPQANGELELLTPYVSTTLNSFVITPVTHIASHVYSFELKKGSNQTDAYNIGISMARQLAGSMQGILRSDKDAGINILKTVPGSAEDELTGYRDVLTGIERFGVRYDLPSSVVAKALARHAEGDYRIDGKDGVGNVINVGNFSGSTYDLNAVRSLGEVIAQRDSMNNLITTNGEYFVNLPPFQISGEFMRNYRLNTACVEKTSDARTAFDLRFPPNQGLYNEPNVCLGAAESIAKDNEALSTNKR